MCEAWKKSTYSTDSSGNTIEMKENVVPPNTSDEDILDEICRQILELEDLTMGAFNFEYFIRTGKLIKDSEVCESFRIVVCSFFLFFSSSAIPCSCFLFFLLSFLLLSLFSSLLFVTFFCFFVYFLFFLFYLFFFFFFCSFLLLFLFVFASLFFFLVFFFALSQVTEAGGSSLDGPLPLVGDKASRVEISDEQAREFCVMLERYN